MTKLLRPSPNESTHVLGIECFLCGKVVVHDSQLMYFKGASALAPKLPCHASCLDGRPTMQVAKEYHRRVADSVNVPRKAIQ